MTIIHLALIRRILYLFLMLIDQLSTYVSGGAGLAALRLHRSLNKQGVRSRLWYGKGEPREAYDGVAAMEWCGKSNWLARSGRKLWQKAALKMATHGRPQGLEPFSTAQAPSPTRFPLARLESDVVHLHWISKSVDYESFFESLPDNQPVVWTLHDMNPFTGGCHYSGGCESFVDGCHHCPQLGRSGPRDLSSRTFFTKRDSTQNKNLHVVAPSHWLTSEAKRSAILGSAKSLQTIHHGIDVALFQPMEKEQARKKLGIDVSNADGSRRAVIAFGAESLENHRKGFHLLLEALKRLSIPTVGLAFGGGEIAARAGLSEIRPQGFIHDAQQQAILYSAADVFIMPSLEEAFGLTVLEAMACGTPVAGFDAGGVADMVRDGQTGRLAQVGDVKDLAAKIEWLIQHGEERQRMGQRAREVVLSDFHEEKQTAKYIELYQRIIADQSHKVAA